MEEINAKFGDPVGLEPLSSDEKAGKHDGEVKREVMVEHVRD